MSAQISKIKEENR